MSYRASGGDSSKTWAEARIAEEAMSIVSASRASAMLSRVCMWDLLFGF